MFFVYIFTGSLTKQHPWSCRETVSRSSDLKLGKCCFFFAFAVLNPDHKATLSHRINFYMLQVCCAKLVLNLAQCRKCNCCLDYVKWRHLFGEESFTFLYHKEWAGRRLGWIVGTCFSCPATQSTADADGNIVNYWNIGETEILTWCWC